MQLGFAKPEAKASTAVKRSRVSKAPQPAKKIWSRGGQKKAPATKTAKMSASKTATIAILSTSSFAQGGGDGIAGVAQAAVLLARVRGLWRHERQRRHRQHVYRHGGSTGASSTNTVGQANQAVSPSNPAATQLGGPNAQAMPRDTVTNQNPSNSTRAFRRGIRSKAAKKRPRYSRIRGLSASGVHPTARWCSLFLFGARHLARTS
jgi:hypothetical protein